MKETQQPTSGLERGAPDLARTPLVRAPVEPRVYRQRFDRERSHRLRAGGHEITNTTTRVYAQATGEWRQAAAWRARSAAPRPPVLDTNSARHESV